MAILIIDDEVSLCRSLEAYLEDMDHEILVADNGQTGLDLLEGNVDKVEAVLVDLNMPVMNGYEFIEQAKKVAPDTPVVVLSGVGVVDDAVKALRLGAWDFIPKPIHTMKVVEHILGKVLERSRLIRENRRYQDHLEELVRQRTEQVVQARRQIMQRLSRAAEYKDNETGHHVIRVGEISALLARALGLDKKQCELLRECAPLHDVGKIGIPDSILLKPGRLNEEERVIMRRHCMYGYEILGPLIGGDVSLRANPDPFKHIDEDDNEFLHLARMLALYHHERWDGKGYPMGLKGEDIPLEARIVAIVDVFDALRSERPYKKAMSLDKSCAILTEGSGTQFDPEVVRMFMQNKDAIATIYDNWTDEE